MHLDPTCQAAVTTDLSFAEQQLWLAERAGATAPPFFDCAPSLSVVTRLDRSVNRRALEASLGEIVRRHDVLRSRYSTATGRPVRVHEDGLPLGLACVDLTCSRSEGPSDSVNQWLVNHVNEPFDLERGPLFRASLVRLSGDEHVLAITVHHMVFDRWSKRVLARELSHLYQAFVTDRRPALEPLPFSYRDYVQMQRDGLDTANGRALTDYWTARLHPLTQLQLPSDGIREEAFSTRTGSWRFLIPPGDASRLGVIGRRCRTTLATVLLAILKLFLFRVSGHDDIAVGVPVSDRRRAGFELLIGLFMNVLVVRSAITGGLTFLDLLDRVRVALLDACRHQDLPYGYLLEVMGTQQPLYRVVFNYMPGIPASEVELPGVHVEHLPIAAEPRSTADLSLHVQNTSGGLACRFVYKADLFSSARVRQFAARFQRLATAIADDSGKSVTAYDLPD